MKKKARIVFGRIKSILGDHTNLLNYREYVFIAKKLKATCQRKERLICKLRLQAKLNREMKDHFLNMEDEIEKLKLQLKVEKTKVIKYDSFLRDKGIKVSKDEILLKEHLNEILERHFNAKEIIELVKDIVDEVSHTVFDFQKIQVDFFGENRIFVIQQAIYQKIQNVIKTDDLNVLNGIKNIILEKNLDKFHSLFATKILEASKVETGIFKFFNGDLIEDSDGVRWSSFAITRFMKDYQSILDKKREVELKLEWLNKALKNCQVISEEDSVDYREYSNRLEEKKKIEKDISKNSLDLFNAKNRVSEEHLKYKKLQKAVTKAILSKKR